MASVGGDVAGDDRDDFGVGALGSRLRSPTFSPESPALFSAALYLVLSILPLILPIFWLVRVRFTNACRKIEIRSKKLEKEKAKSGPG